MISPEKATMFRNRLVKVFRHMAKSAKKQASPVTGYMIMTFPNFRFALKNMKTGFTSRNTGVTTIWRKRNMSSGWKVVKRL